MHIAVIRETHRVGKMALSPGEYVIEDINAAELLARDLCRLREPDVTVRSFDSSLDWNGKRILLVRPGGFGDLLFLTPCIAEIKRRWPQSIVNVACFPQYRDALEGNPDVDAFEEYPVAVCAFDSYDAHVWLENYIERDPKAKEIHVIDLLSERLGLEVSDTSDKRMRFHLTAEEMAAALERYPRNSKKRAGIQVFSSSPVRSYPPKLTVETARELMRRGWELFLFGSPGQVNSDSGPGIVNLTQRQPPASFRESAAILKTCDVCIAPDSSLCHIAGILEIPTVALYGSFPWQLRTAYAPSIYAINGHGPCAPCFHHSRGGQVFPEGKPCALTGECNVLGSIEPRRIVAKVEALFE